jgi:hypothetical protein
MPQDFIKAVGPIRWDREDESIKSRWLQELREKSPLIQTYAATLTPGQVSANSFLSEAYTITGVEAADTIIGFKTAGGTIYTTPGEITIVHKYVSAANTITIVFENTTGGALTPTSQVYTFTVVRTE